MGPLDKKMLEFSTYSDNSDIIYKHFHLMVKGVEIQED